eukprot:5808622-Amphidinium_carterae.1
MQQEEAVVEWLVCCRAGVASTPYNVAINAAFEAVSARRGDLVHVHRRQGAGEERAQISSSCVFSSFVA